MMRDAIIAAALANTKWAGWSQTPIAGDASARRYFRLHRNSKTGVILMDDPSTGTEATARFADIARALLACGLSAPKILHHEADLGLMVIEDLGATDFAAHLRSNPTDEAQLYSAATIVLGQLHRQKFILPLGTITAPVAADMIDLAALHYAPTAIARDELNDAVQDAFNNTVDQTPHIALRDFHAENLIWRPERNGTDQIGLLDFQDACYAPAGYDLMSLLRDARRDVDPRVATKAIKDFCETGGLSVASMEPHLACVSAQRNLRILGIFARLTRQDGKTKYLTLLPRVWKNLMTDLDHPALKPLRTTVLAALPPPNSDTLRRLAAA